MKTQTSKLDNYTKLTTYDNGVEYIISGSASWLVGADDKIGTNLKAKHFPESPKGIAAEDPSLIVWMDHA